MDSLDAHVRLRLDALAGHAAFRPSDQAEARVREHLNPVHRDGVVEVLEHGGEVRAVFAWRHDPEPWSGAPVSQVEIDVSGDDDATRRWLGERLDRELPRMDAEPWIFLDRSQRLAFDALRARGLGVDSVQLLGEPRRALSRLAGDDALPDDLAFEPLDEARIDAALALQRETFEAHPEFCSFGAHPRWLAQLGDGWREELASPGHLQRVLLVRGRVVGHVCATVEPDNPFFGPCAGMGLVLAPALRGRGLSRPLYRRLLRAALERGARVFKGGTSQPPVLRLAVEMDRPLQGVLLRRRTWFDDAHFAPYLPLAPR